MSLLSISGEGGFYGHSLNSVGVFDLRQQIRCSEVLDCPQEQVSLASMWLYLVWYQEKSLCVVRIASSRWSMALGRSSSGSGLTV